MNADQHYCLRWNNFQTNVVSEFESLRSDESFVDVTLSCGGKQLKAHKLVLSASSPYFKQIFKDNPCKHPIVVLQDIDYDVLSLIIEYVYTGAVSVSEQLMTTLLRTADMLRIRGLTETSPSSIPTSANAVITERNKKENSEQTEAEAVPAAKKARKYCDKVGISNFDELKREVDTSTEEDGKMSIFNSEILSDNNRPDSQTSALLEFQGNTDSIEGPSNIFNLPGDLIAEVTRNGTEQSKSHSLDPRPCPVCGHVYSNLSNLRQHIRLIHNPECVSCPLCSKTFKNKLYLKRHLISFHDMLSPSQDQDRAKAAVYSNLVNNATLSTDHNMTPVDPRSYSHVMSTQAISPRRRHDEINNMLFVHQKNLMTSKSAYFDQNLEEKLDSSVDTNNSSSCYNQFQHFNSLMDKTMMSSNPDNLANHDKQSVMSLGKHQYLTNNSSNNPSNEIQN